MRIAVFAALFAFFLPVIPAQADTLRPPETGYSATRIVTAGDQEISGKIFSQDQMERWEMTMQGMRQISILRFDEGTGYIYMPDMNMAMKMNIAEAASYGSGTLHSSVEAKEAGTEIIEGEETTRYLVPPSEENGHTETMVWITGDGIPMKIEGSSTEGRFSMTLKDLERGEQDPSLFRLPAGVAPMEMPAGMPGMMQGGMPGMPR